MNNKVYVWDRFVRFSHWTLVLAFVIAYFTGDEENALHVYSGYYILGLLTLRIIWGIIGSRYARFSNFVYSPSAVIHYLKGFVAIGKDKKYTGHNPAGSWMVIIMLISLILTGYSGLQVYGAEGHGPLAQNSEILSMQQSGALKVSSYEQNDNAYNDGNKEEFWEEIHEFFANFTVFLVLLHIAGVIASSIKQKQNLAKSMITGHKNK